MNYYKIIIKKNMAEKAVTQNFIGIGFKVLEDLSPYLKNDYSFFKKHFLPLYLQLSKSKGWAHISAMQIWSFAKEIKKGDRILFFNDGLFYIGEITGDYYYDKNDEDIKHRRKIKWIGAIEKASTSHNFQNWINNGLVRATLRHIDDSYYKDLSNVINLNLQSMPFRGLEKKLETIIIKNWNNLSLSKNYDIKENQYNINSYGIIDILAKHKTKNEYLVIELKKGSSTDKSLGQILRYMGWVKKTYGGNVKGLIVTHSYELLKTATSIINDPYQKIKVKSPSEIINECINETKKAA